jgi:SAM-dependent methyltransferase
MTSEFDGFAADYKTLLHDPIREHFAPESHFFCERKWLLLMELLPRFGMNTAKARWLDVGCGQGELLRLGHTAFAEAAGCDVSAEMVSRCGEVPVYKQSDPATLPFPDRSFDFVTAVCVYHHVAGQERMLLARAIERVLKPGGLFCIIEHNPWNPITRTIVRRCPVDADARLLTAGQTRSLMRYAGFGVMDTRFFLYLPERMFRVTGQLERAFGRLPMGGQYAVVGKKPLDTRSHWRA